MIKLPDFVTPLKEITGIHNAIEVSSTFPFLRQVSHCANFSMPKGFMVVINVSHPVLHFCGDKVLHVIFFIGKKSHFF